MPTPKKTFQGRIPAMSFLSAANEPKNEDESTTTLNPDQPSIDTSKPTIINQQTSSDLNEELLMPERESIQSEPVTNNNAFINNAQPTNNKNEPQFRQQTDTNIHNNINQETPSVPFFKQNSDVPFHGRNNKRTDNIYRNVIRDYRLNLLLPTSVVNYITEEAAKLEISRNEYILRILYNYIENNYNPESYH